MDSYISRWIYMRDIDNLKLKLNYLNIICSFSPNFKTLTNIFNLFSLLNTLKIVYLI